MNMPKEFVDSISQLRKLVFQYESKISWFTEFYERMEAEHPQIVEKIENQMGGEEDSES